MEVFNAEVQYYSLAYRMYLAHTVFSVDVQGLRNLKCTHR